MKKLLPRLVVSLLIAAGFVWVLKRGGLPLMPDEASFRGMSWSVIPVYAALWIAASFLRTYRWLYLLRPIAPNLSRWRVFGMGLIGFSAVFLAPLRSGEVVRPYLIANDGDVDFFQATGTVGAERVVDGLVLTLVTFFALWLAPPLSPLPDKLGDLPLPVSALPAAVYSALVFFACAFAAMALFYWARDLARRLTLAVVGVVSRPLAEFLTRKVERIAEGLSFLPSRANLFSFLRETGLYWALAIAAQWLLLRASGLQAGLAEACVTFGVMGIGSLVPSGPGFFGAYQIAGFSALALYFTLSEVRDAGAAFLFVSYVTQFVLNTLPAVLGVWLMNKFPRLAPEPGAATSSPPPSPRAA
ncbi:MAG TPA: lysylphosphatidylglycerol synthase transmembrane domain-containing protein [Polyangiaceae bacterium]|jgi:uncharacterized protein (TIRG00374 family)|nr:lysylphosphatidylglycerol synthase transmembrane domain-containing protein [Polyangiaceae bacterium]